MKRKAIDDLIQWKEKKKSIPILLTGAKGVGKTYLAYDFAKAFFERIYYVNFEREPYLKELFDDENQAMIRESLSDYFHLNPEEDRETRILILDEISSCTQAMKAIDYRYLSDIFPFVLNITSNVISDQYTANIIKLPIFPLEFDEFLRATSNEWYIELIMTHFNSNKKIPEIVHKELLELHQLYLQTGGMPGAVNEFLNFNSLINVSEQHSFLTGAYHDVIFKEYQDSDAFKMNQVFDSLLLQLIKENKKFQYKLIRKGTTHSMYKEAIKKLSDINYIIKCNRIRNEQLNGPFTSIGTEESIEKEEETSFKLYFPDTGLLFTKIIEEYGTAFDRIQRKALLENYVAQSLQAKRYPFAFWESDSMAKIDFIIYKDSSILPIEIFEDDNTRSKSISILKQKCEFPYAVKISAKNFEYVNQIKYVPYYAVFCL